MSRSVFEDVLAYMTTERRGKFRRLYEDVETACEAAKQALGGDVVMRIYGRAFKQGDELLKTDTKIVAKILKKRKEIGDQNYGVRDLKDIVGITAVVQYPGQVDTFIDHVSKLLSIQRIQIAGREKIQRSGYFATHIDLQSKHVRHADFFCELQVKTMLHDSWSIKMHDLNYKPSGVIDHRLDRMMRIIADTLEVVELQSESIRDLIVENWGVTTRWRAVARQSMLSSNWPALIGESETSEILYAEMIKCFNGNEKTSNYIDPADFVTRILTVKKESARDGWLLACFLASYLAGDTEYTEFAIGCMEDWLGTLDIKIIPEDNIQHYLRVAAFSYAAIGHLDKAVEFSEWLLSTVQLNESIQMIVRWNLANFLVERQYFNPAPPEEALKDRSAIEKMIAECDELKKLDLSMFHDLNGMLDVAFSYDPDKVREAINLIERGKTEAEDPTDQLVVAYHNLHIRLAWRKLLDLEAKLSS